MVAAVCSWHEHHVRAAAEINRRLAARATLIVAAPALAETYAVLTRLPPPHRLSPADAWYFVHTNFAGAGKVVALTGPEYVTLLQRAHDRGISGGRIYDAVIAACAHKGRARSLLTFNDTHFVALAEPGLEIVVP